MRFSLRGGQYGGIGAPGYFGLLVTWGPGDMVPGDMLLPADMAMGFSTGRRAAVTVALGSERAALVAKGRHGGGTKVADGWRLVGRYGIRMVLLTRERCV